MTELVAFLGNPGREYSRNRHNAGFLLAEKLPFHNALSWQKKFSGLCAITDRSRLAEYLSEDPSSMTETDGRFHFIKPETYMNNSGKPVIQAAAFFKIKHDAILVVHDDLELPLGTLSLKFGGGLGGHNGLRSMKACLGTADFWRLRIGIGRPNKGTDVVNWVLSDFDAAETETLDRVLETGVNLLLMAMAKGPEGLLPEWAKKKVPAE
jgi:PTH1 family peptidyl-tRNA hydrolase